MKETEAGAKETAPPGLAGEGADPEKTVPPPLPPSSAAYDCYSFRDGRVQPLQDVLTASSDQDPGFRRHIHTYIHQ